MHHLFLVMLGGAIGAGARHLIGRAALALWGPGFPVGTLAVNVIGGLAMGLLAGWLATRASGDEALRYLLGVGVLGGFTTFSAFSLAAVSFSRAILASSAAFSISSSGVSVAIAFINLL